MLLSDVSLTGSPAFGFKDGVWRVHLLSRSSRRWCRSHGVSLPPVEPLASFRLSRHVAVSAVPSGATRLLVPPGASRCRRRSLSLCKCPGSRCVSRTRSSPPVVSCSVLAWGPLAWWPTVPMSAPRPVPCLPAGRQEQARARRSFSSQDL